MVLTGDLTLEEINQYVDLAAQLKAQYGHFFIIDDMARLGSVEPAVRRKLASWLGDSGCLGAAVYGASLTARTLVLLILRAMTLLGRHVLPLAFFKSESEARSWVAAQRDQLSAKRS